MFNSLYMPSDSHPELREFLAQNMDFTGAKLLSILINEPNTPIDVMELALRIDHDQPEKLPFLALLASAYADIPYIDSIAVCQYRKRLAQLIESKERLQASDPTADCSELDYEMNFLARELRTSTTPRGTIKNLNPDKKKALDRFRVAVKRLLERAEPVNPQLCALIRKSLVYGKAMLWKEG
jgi:hypothetical protein